MRLLLRHPRIDVNKCRTDDGTTALWMAAQVDLKIVRLLLRHPGIDVNNSRTDDGRTALWMAALIGQVEVVELLVAHPAIDVNKSRCDDCTRFVISYLNGRHCTVFSGKMKHSHVLKF